MKLGCGFSAARVLVFGGSGQLGTALRALAPPPDMVLIYADRQLADFENPRTLQSVIREVRPDLVLNAAALTDAGSAEANRDRALAVNAMAVEVIAMETARQGTALLQISSAEVFDGMLARPYREIDAMGPLNVVGATKLLGEKLALLGNPRTTVLRTAWPYGSAVHGLVGSILAEARKPEGLHAVRDEWSSPTCTEDLAKACLRIVPQLVSADALQDVWGLTHCAGQGTASRLEFAEAVVAFGGGAKAKIAPLWRANLRAMPLRPRATPLDCTRLTRVFGVRMRPWRDALSSTVARIVKNKPLEVA